MIVGHAAGALVVMRVLERYAARAYNARLRMFVGMGHSMMLDVGWEEPLKAMETWLERTVLGS